MVKNNKGISLIKLIIIIFILVIIIGIGWFYYKNKLNEDNLLASNNINNTVTNEIEKEATNEVKELNVEEWRKKLWDYFIDYENYFSIRLENENGKNEVEDNNFLVKKGYELASIEEKANPDGSVNKKDFEEVLLKYYGKTPENYNTDMFEFDSEKETISLREGSGYDSHGTSVFFLKEISLNGTEYVAEFDTYHIPENVAEGFEDSVYSEFLTFEEDGESTIMDFDYDKLYESLSKSNLKFQEYRGRDIKIKFEEKDNGIYQINWLSSTN